MRQPSLQNRCVAAATGVVVVAVVVADLYSVQRIQSITTMNMNAFPLGIPWIFLTAPHTLWGLVAVLVFVPS
jgi:hypothetical protein